MGRIAELTEDLMERMNDPFPGYLIKKEIRKKHLTKSDLLNIHGSKWYQQLADEQWENGSWGRFHTQDTKSSVRQKFVTTEAAISRIHDLCLDDKDEMVHKVVLLMERYLRKSEEWPDTVENHYGFQEYFHQMIAADLSVFKPDHPLVQQEKELCARKMEEAFSSGNFEEEKWNKELRKRKEVLLIPCTVYMVYMLQKNEYVSPELERNYMEYIWNKKEGIYYRTNSPSADLLSLEAKNFTRWLGGLECLSGFSLFPEFMAHGVAEHLLHEMDRLRKGNVVLPTSPAIIGHYSESWTKKDARNKDMRLRILRILAKCNLE